MVIKIVYVTKDGCGICHLMEGTWKRFQSLFPRYTYDHFHADNNLKAKRAYALGVRVTPAWIIYRDSEVIGVVSGGMRLKTLTERIRKVIDNDV